MTDDEYRWLWWTGVFFPEFFTFGVKKAAK